MRSQVGQNRAAARRCVDEGHGVLEAPHPLQRVALPGLRYGRRSMREPRMATLNVRFTPSLPARRGRTPTGESATRPRGPLRRADGRALQTQSRRSAKIRPTEEHCAQPPGERNVGGGGGGGASEKRACQGNHRMDAREHSSSPMDEPQSECGVLRCRRFAAHPFFRGPEVVATGR